MVFVLAAGIWPAGFLPPAVAASAQGNQPLSEGEIEKLLMPYRKMATLLQPCLSAEPLGFDQSKMGGIPNLNGFNTGPRATRAEAR